ncbi:MAG TPA: LysE family translocator [Jatrophihabitantaceae bacterium]|nr:LysE family translocator [Jatrophihabitantaceae bacterium]
MELSALLAFAGVAITLIVVPGPDWAFVITAGARDRIVLPAVAGLVAGYLLLTAVVALGAGPLVAATPAASVALSFVGAGYLLKLGVGILRSPAGRLSAEPVSGAARSLARTFRHGVGVSALNPKGLLFFLAFLPQFARPARAGSWPFAVQLAVLGVAWAVICALFYTALGYTADRALAARPGLNQVITRVAGAAMIAIGAVLVADAVRKSGLVL